MKLSTVLLSVVALAATYFCDVRDCAACGPLRARLAARHATACAVPACAPATVAPVPTIPAPPVIAPVPPACTPSTHLGTQSCACDAPLQQRRALVGRPLVHAAGRLLHAVTHPLRTVKTLRGR